MSSTYARERLKSSQPLFLILSVTVVVLCLRFTRVTSTSTSTSDHSIPQHSSVSYDHRALVIDGQRRFLISGSIHYPRSTPQMWPGLLKIAKEGGLDVIDTYVFWDLHEPVKGTWNFNYPYDLVGFIKAVQNVGLFVNLRIGPYICAEWNFGGFPEWLREIPGIKFRTENKPFEEEMARFLKFIVRTLQDSNLFLTQGGPIIVAQVENEYRHIAKWYGDEGKKYMDWAAALAQNLNTTVPWIMCSQVEAPANIIDTCNGFYCDKFSPNSYNKPKMWTENYPGWFQYWGQPLRRRPVEDTAYAVARFFQKGGSFMNYYMYHGGTNFGRTSARSITTSYDYGSPIDEYGQARQPDWQHLKALHKAIKLCEPALAASDDEPFHWTIAGNPAVEIHIYSSIKNADEKSEHKRMRFQGSSSSSLCAAFLANNGLDDATVEFLGQSYHLPAWSVSILPDCEEVIFNTAKVSAQTSLTHMVDVPVGGTVSPQSSTFQSEWYEDPVGVWGDTVVHVGTLEQYSTTHDLTDYLWYTTLVNLPKNQQQDPFQKLWLKIRKVQDLVHVFINGKLVDESPTWNSSGFYQQVILQPGTNSIALLSVTVGLPDSGPFLEAHTGGLIGPVTLQGLPAGDMDLTNVKWTHQVGLKGENLHLESDEVSNNVDIWSSTAPPVNRPLIWYRAKVDIDSSRYGPIVLDLRTMNKGSAWINGHHLGRYWSSQTNPAEGCYQGCDYKGKFNVNKCILNCGKASQRWYHVPREWMKPTGNILVIFEEVGGDSRGVSISRPVVHTVCSHISESHPSGTRANSASLRSGETIADHLPQLALDCGASYFIANITFASMGNPSGRCGQFARGSCHASRSVEIVEKACIGRQECSLSFHRNAVGEDPCPGRENLSLAVQALCKPE